MLTEGLADSIEDVSELKPENRDLMLDLVGPMIVDLYCLLDERSMWPAGTEDPRTFWD